MDRGVVPAPVQAAALALAFALTLVPALASSASLAASGYKESKGAQRPIHAPRSVQALRFIGEQRIAHKQEFAGTTVGGLSGIDYDAGTDTWIIASDDRSDFSPARFYTARLDYDAQAFHDAALTAATPFRQPGGAPYPSRWWGGELADVESIRFDPADGSIWYASEGDRGRGLDPFIRQATLAGNALASLPIPAMFRMQAGRDAGPYNNRAFEGMTFASDGRSLWVAMEGPLVQDGELPSPAAGAMARITQYERDGTMRKQVAYPIDAIPAAPGPLKYADNGVTEILAVDDERLLVLERAAVQDAGGKFTNYVRIYEMDVSAATDVSSIASLADAGFRPVSKRLVLDLATLDLPRLDNVEGMAWGPRLANGRDSLVLVSDDNFNAGQVTQVLAFEIIGRHDDNSATP